jgi:hypothetical protein
MNNDDNERRLAQAENKLVDLSVRDALNQLARRGKRIKPETYGLLPDVLRGELVEHGDGYRVTGSEHMSLADCIADRFRNRPGWDCYIQPAGSGGAKRGQADEDDDFDLDSFNPGQATEEDRRKLRAALQRFGEREEAKRKAQR